MAELVPVGRWPSHPPPACLARKRVNVPALSCKVREREPVHPVAEILSVFYDSDFHPNKTILNLSSDPLFLIL